MAQWRVMVPVMMVGMAMFFGVFVLYGPGSQGEGGIGATPGSATMIKSLRAQVTKLQHEKQQLQKLAQDLTAELQKSMGKAVALPVAAMESASTDLNIDLVRFLGVQSYFVGISYDPFVCFPPLKVVYPNDTIWWPAVRERMVKQLVDEQARIRGVPADAVQTSLPWHMQPSVKEEQGAIAYPKDVAAAARLMAGDERFKTWRAAIPVVLAHFLVDAGGHTYACERGKKVEPQDLGNFCLDGKPENLLDEMGYHNAPYMPIDNIVDGVFDTGTCTTHVRNHRDSYTDWLLKERMDGAWWTFHTENQEQDKVMLLFDMLYEKMQIFTRQYWMGVITMQNPFDVYVIQDIIYTQQIDLIIETGTANGGSALLWSGIMELAGLEDAKIITSDLNSPVWDPKESNWGGKAREDPTKSKLWKKRVTFVKGNTIGDEVIEAVDKAAKGKKAILVLLDSAHHKEHVLEEMKKYCYKVTVGSYCIVEDTKMSRWHSNGPWEAVKQFMAIPGNAAKFQVDRSKELLYSHHTGGYIKRIAK